MAEGLATLAASVYPKHTIGEQHEPDEVSTSMIGFQGCGRYAEQFFVEGFAIEQGAVKLEQGAMALKNAKIISLFVHALDTARDLNEVLERNGSKCRGDGLKVNMMAELPSDAFLAEEFLVYFTGLSMRSNDLIQLTLGSGRDSGLAAHFVIRNPASMKGP